MKQIKLEIMEKEEKIKSIKPSLLEHKQHQILLLNISKEQANEEL